MDMNKHAGRWLAACEDERLFRSVFFQGKDEREKLDGVVTHLADVIVGQGKKMRTVSEQS